MDQKMTSARKIQITTESHETFRLRIHRRDRAFGFCRECSAEVEIVTLDQAVWMTGIHTREMLRLFYVNDTDATETETLSASSPLTVPIQPGSTPIDGRATYEIGEAFGGNLSLDTGANAMLKIDHAADFRGAVAGFDGSDVLDLADVAFGKNTTLGYAANSSNTGGTLTVSDGTHTADISLLGQYMAGSFVMSADGFGGTQIQNPPAATLTLTHPQHA